MMGYQDGMGWWMLWGGLMMVLFWGGLFAVVYRIFRSVRADRNNLPIPGQHRESAVDIARRRFASGEINEGEFDRIMNRVAG